MQARGSNHIDQGIEAKQFDLAAREIGDTRLGNAKQLGSLRTDMYEAKFSVAPMMDWVESFLNQIVRWESCANPVRACSTILSLDD
jgi:hypothetical protein